jgi:hypothetical protein
MAIEQFGESLLSQKRKRDEDQARKLRRREERNALLGLAGTVGIGLYRQNLKNKQQDFLNNQAVLDAKLQARLGNQAAAQYTEEYNKTQSYAGGERAYYRDNYMLPQVAALVAQKGDISFKSDRERVNFERRLAEELMDSKDEQGFSPLDYYSKTLSAATGIDPTVDAATHLKNNRYTPNSVASYFSSRVFGKKTGPEIYQDAVESFENSEYVGKRADVLKFRKFMAEGLSIDESDELVKKINAFHSNVQTDRASTYTPREYEEILPDGTKLKRSGFTRTDARGNITFLDSDKKLIDQDIVPVTREVVTRDSLGRETTEKVISLYDTKNKIFIQEDLTTSPRNREVKLIDFGTSLPTTVKESGESAFAEIALTNITVNRASDGFKGRQIKPVPLGDAIAALVEEGEEGDLDVSTTIKNNLTYDVGFTGSFIKENNFGLNASRSYELAAAIVGSDAARSLSGDGYSPQLKLEPTANEGLTGLQIIDGLVALEGVPGKKFNTIPEPLARYILSGSSVGEGPEALANEIATRMETEQGQQILQDIFTQNENFKVVLNKLGMGEENELYIALNNIRNPRPPEDALLDGANQAARREPTELDKFVEKELAAIKPSRAANKNKRNMLIKYNQYRELGVTGNQEIIKDLERQLSLLDKGKRDAPRRSNIIRKIKEQEEMQRIMQSLSNLMG